MSFTVYILQSISTMRYYVGQTNDLDQRLLEHNGSEAGHTKKEQPWKVIWFYTVQTRSEALKLEKKIKKRGAQRFLNDIKKLSPG